MRDHLKHMSNIICELAKMGYELIDEQQVDDVICSLPNDWPHIKTVLSRTKYILTFKNIRQQLDLEEE